MTLPIQIDGQETREFHYEQHEPLIQEIWQRFGEKGFDQGSVYCILARLFVKFLIESNINPYQASLALTYILTCYEKTLDSN